MSASLNSCRSDGVGDEAPPQSKVAEIAFCNRLVISVLGLELELDSFGFEASETLVHCCSVDNRAEIVRTSVFWCLKSENRVGAEVGNVNWNSQAVIGL